MSTFLQQLSENKITIEEALQRLLVIANKTNNDELADWCNKELNGYNNFNELPEYRKFISRHIFYSGINGGYQVNNTPLGPGYLSEETLKKVETVGLFENIAQVQVNKDTKETIYKDLTVLAGEVYKNTNDGYIGVQCTSIKQLIPQSNYSKIYSSVKTRIINLLCSFESANIDIDKLDISKQSNAIISSMNKELFKSVVIEGGTFSFEKKSNKILWSVLIPIITTVVGGVIVFLITKYL